MSHGKKRPNWSDNGFLNSHKATSIRKEYEAHLFLLENGKRHLLELMTEQLRKGFLHYAEKTRGIEE